MIVMESICGDVLSSALDFLPPFHRAVAAAAIWGTPLRVLPAPCSVRQWQVLAYRERHPWVAEAAEAAGAAAWNSALMEACRADDLPAAERLIARGAVYLDEGLALACFRGNVALAEALVRAGASYWEWGLQGACAGGQQETVDMMLEKGAVRGLNAFWDACAGGNIKVVRRIVQTLLSPTVPLRIRFPPYATRTDSHLEVVEYLLSLGAEISPHTVGDAYLLGAPEKITDLMLENVSFDDSDKNLIDTLLTYAAQGSDLRTVQKLVERGATVTPYIISIAPAGDNTHVVRYLLEKYESSTSDSNDPRPVLSDMVLNNALEKSCVSGNTELVDLFISLGASNWDKGLRAACLYGHLGLAREMRSRGGVLVPEDQELGADYPYEFPAHMCSGPAGLRYALSIMEKMTPAHINRWFLGACGEGASENARTFIEHGADAWTEACAMLRVRAYPPLDDGLRHLIWARAGNDPQPLPAFVAGDCRRLDPDLMSSILSGSSFASTEL